MRAIYLLAFVGIVASACGPEATAPQPVASTPAVPLILTQALPDDSTGPIITASELFYAVVYADDADFLADTLLHSAEELAAMEEQGCALYDSILAGVPEVEQDDYVVGDFTPGNCYKAYTRCSARCRRIPNPRGRAICWGACMAVFAICLANERNQGLQ